MGKVEQFNFISTECSKRRGRLNIFDVVLKLERSNDKGTTRPVLRTYTTISILLEFTYCLYGCMQRRDIVFELP